MYKNRKFISQGGVKVNKSLTLILKKMRKIKMNLSDIGGIDLDAQQKQFLKGGVELPIWCNCDVFGGQSFQGWCGLSTPEACEEALALIYTDPAYDCACEYWTGPE